MHKIIQKHKIFGYLVPIQTEFNDKISLFFQSNLRQQSYYKDIKSNLQSDLKIVVQVLIMIKKSSDFHVEMSYL